jgi:hypothetical protein
MEDKSWKGNDTTPHKCKQFVCPSVGAVELHICALEQYSTVTEQRSETRISNRMAKVGEPTMIGEVPFHNH